MGEAGAPKNHKNAVVKAGVHDTHRCEAFSGRPLRIVKTPYSRKWVEERSDVLNERIRNGILPAEEDFKQVSGAITEILPARQIVDEMVLTACNMMKVNNAKV